jgi:hypothetical protein
MQIKRFTITLPARMKHTAHLDARVIAEAIAQAAYANGGQVDAINIPGHGHSSHVLASRVTAAIPKAKGGNSHGS